MPRYGDRCVLTAEKSGHAIFKIGRDIRAGGGKNLYPKISQKVLRWTTSRSEYVDGHELDRRNGVVQLSSFFCNCDCQLNKNQQSESSDFWNSSRTPYAVFKLVESSAYVDALRR